MASNNVIIALSKSENVMINMFNDMYCMVKSHEKNRKVAKNDLIKLFDTQLTAIIREIELLKVNDENANVDSTVNNILNDVMNNENNNSFDNN